MSFYRREARYRIEIKKNIYDENYMDHSSYGFYILELWDKINSVRIELLVHMEN